MATVIAVIIVISIVLSIPSILSSYEETQYVPVITTKANLKMLHHAVAQFKMDTGRYPTQKEGLNVLVEKPAEVTNYQEGGYPCAIRHLNPIFNQHG